MEDLGCPELAPEDARHLGEVRRLRDGESVIASDGQGGWRACRAIVARRSVTLEPEGIISVEAPQVPKIVVGYSLVKGDRTEWAAAKLTELGTDCIVPLICDRTVVRSEDERGRHRAERLKRIVREAGMQSRLVRLPELAEPRPVAQMSGADLSGETCLADPAGGPLSLAFPVILVGPEGGWSPEELARAEQAGLGSAALGPHVLRVETAAVVAGGILCALRANLVSAEPSR